MKTIVSILWILLFSVFSLHAQEYKVQQRYSVAGTEGSIHVIDLDEVRGRNSKTQLLQLPIQT